MAKPSKEKLKVIQQYEDDLFHHDPEDGPMGYIFNEDETTWGWDDPDTYLED